MIFSSTVQKLIMVTPWQTCLNRDHKMVFNIWKCTKRPWIFENVVWVQLQSCQRWYEYYEHCVLQNDKYNSYIWPDMIWRKKMHTLCNQSLNIPIYFLNQVKFEFSSAEKWSRNALNISNVLLQNQKLISLNLFSWFLVQYFLRWISKKKNRKSTGKIVG